MARFSRERRPVSSRSKDRRFFVFYEEFRGQGPDERKRECAGTEREPFSFSCRMPAWETIRHRIGIRLVGEESREGLPAAAPTRDVLDLVLFCYIYWGRRHGKCATSPVTWDHLHRWKVSEDTLFRQALENAGVFFAPEFCPVEDMIASLLLCGCGETEEETGQGRCRIGGGVPLYVVTNRLRFFGASAVLVPGVLRTLARETGWEECCLLPSSIHEMMALPADFADRESLRAMVRDVNDQAVEESERLSYSIYRYDPARDALRLEGDTDGGERPWVPLKNFCGVESASMDVDIPCADC